MEFYKLVLLAAIFTTGLVAGLFFTFTTLIMPGLSTLRDGEYIRAYKAIDGILQPNPAKRGTQPFFALVFFGAMITLIGSIGLGYTHFDSIARMLAAAALLIYVAGMIAPTLAVNLPLNNQIQTYQVDQMNEREHKAARLQFEPRWSRWNLVRTVASAATFMLLIILLNRVTS